MAPRCTPLKASTATPDSQEMRELRLIEILSEAAAALTAPQTDPEAVERVLAAAVTRASLPCTLHPSSTGVEIDCTHSPGRMELAFVSVLSDCAKLAVAAVGASAGRTLDAHAFALELERAASIARWRGQPLAVAVFEVSGLEMGPGMIDQADTVAEVGELALSAVRQDDRVGHLGAAQFALVFPRAGTFEARSAFKRVRAALAASERMSRDLAIGPVGFAELNEGGSGAAVLAAARERQTKARVRHAYLAPVDPTHPLAG
jgi:GGDEF domain-containing protein